MLSSGSGKGLLVTLVPVGLAVCAVLLGAVTRGIAVDPEAWTWSLIPTTVLILGRLVHHGGGGRPSPGSRAAGLVVWANLAVVLGASLLNPFMCIYAFSGYADADRLLRGRQVTVATIATGLICAMGQTGGVPGVRGAAWLWPGLAVVNIGIAWMMLRASREREASVRAREVAAAELLAEQNRNADLQEQLLRRAHATGIDEERARLSREIHDTVAQGLVGVIRQLEALPTVESAIRLRIERAEESARECLTEVRRAVRAMAPRQLEEADLVSALQETITGWARTHRIVAEFDADEPPPPSPHDAVLLRAAQEALANIARHSGATIACVILDGSDGWVRLQIADDGVGFEPDLARGVGHGLRGLADRVEGAGGRLRCESAPGRGCTITVEVPC